MHACVNAYGCVVARGGMCVYVCASRGLCRPYVHVCVRMICVCVRVCGCARVPACACKCVNACYDIDFIVISLQILGTGYPCYARERPFCPRLELILKIIIILLIIFLGFIKSKPC